MRAEVRNMITRRSILTVEEIVFVNLGSEGEPEPRLLQGAELVLQRHAHRRDISQAPVL